MGDGSVCKHKLSASMLAGVVHVYLLGKADWSEALGQKMVTKEREKRGQKEASVTPDHPTPKKILGDRKETEEIFFHPGLTCPL